MTLRKILRVDYGKLTSSHTGRQVARLCHFDFNAPW